jgi:hypothetical protein
VRSEAIEIIVPKLDLWHLGEWNLPPSDRKLSIGSLDPHTTVVVTIVTNHDGRAIRIVEGVSGLKLRSDDLNDYSDYFGIGKFVLANSAQVMIWLSAIAFVVLFSLELFFAMELQDY